LEEALPAAEGLASFESRQDASNDSGIVQRFGPYELLEEIGRGGMGVIYKARQEGLDRIVALKMLLAGEFADAKARERLLREAKVAARLAHPNLVTIHDAGESQGRVYFAMEYVPGLNLAQLTQERMLPIGQAARLMAELARAIDYAHRNGVVHRDLKPANVLVTPDGRPKLTDFGLTRSTFSDAASCSLESAGTPNFMSPEQADPRSGKTGTHTDIFGLGALLYFVLTGHPPVRGDTLAEVLREAVEGRPIPPRKLRGELPGDLEAICLKCLEKAPAHRYAGAAEVAGELERFLNGQPVRTRANVWRRLAFNRSRGPFLLGATGLSLALLAVVIPSRFKEPRTETTRDTVATSPADSAPLPSLDDFEAHEPRDGWVRPDRLFDARTGSFTQSNGQLGFANPSAAPALIQRTWKKELRNDRDWTVQVDVRLARWPERVGTNDVQIALRLEIFNAARAGDSVLQEYLIQPNDAGFPDRFVGGQFSLSNTFRGLGTTRNLSGPNSPEWVTLQIRFDARLQTMTLASVSDGRAGTNHFEVNAILPVAQEPIQWSSATRFGLRLSAYSRGVPIRPGFAAFDNLRATGF
jgi:serine/threonine protein kinase